MIFSPFAIFLAGSAGDPNAPQLIVDNRSVTIEYGDKRKENNSLGTRSGPGGGVGGDFHQKPVRSDWLCEAVS